MNRDAQDKRIAAVLEENEDLDFNEAVKVFYEYFKSHLSLPCIVTGVEDFRWEEIYVFGPGDEEEYDRLKKKQPSYTDQYKLLGIDCEAESGWHKPDLLVTSGLCLPLGMATKGVILWTLSKKCVRHLGIFDVSKINCLKESCNADENPPRSVPCLDSSFVCPGAGAEKVGRCIGFAA
jgi:hypothetical protein